MKTKFVFLLLIDSLFSHFVLAQEERNNFLFPEGTTFAAEGELGHIEKVGNGPVSLILIADVGFGWDIYKEFMERNKKRYTMYAVTLPGSDHTASPAPPVEGTSFGKRTWLEGIQKGLLDLMEKEKMNRPVIAGNLILATWFAMNTAIKYPDRISKVILFGGLPYSTWPSPKDPSGKTPVSLGERTGNVDFYTAPKMYKKLSKEIWDKNLYQPQQYSSDLTLGKQLFNASASTPISVMARYLCEFYTTDLSEDFTNIKVPILVLVPGFDEKYLVEYAKLGDKKYFQDNWEKAKVNKQFQFEIIPNARLFVWRDQLKTISNRVDMFLK